MRKGLIAIATVVALLLSLGITAFAAPTASVPANLNGVVAFSFSEGMDRVGYTNEQKTGIYFNGGNAQIEAQTDASLVDYGAGKGVKITAVEEIEGQWLHFDGIRQGTNWPAAGTPIKGWFFRVKCEGGEAWLSKFRMRAQIAPGIMNGTVNTETVIRDVYPANGSEMGVRTFDLQGNELYDPVDPKNGYDAQVMLEDGFDGYVVIDFSEGVFVEPHNGEEAVLNTEVDNISWMDIVGGDSVAFNFIDWMEEGASITFGDYGYLTDYPEAPAAPSPSPSPSVEPSVEPSTEPTDEPTDEPIASVEPSVEPTDEPTDEPVASVEPSAEPTEEPTDEPDESAAPGESTEPDASDEPADGENGPNIGLIIGIVAGILVIAGAVVAFIIIKGKKNGTEETAE